MNANRFRNALALEAVKGKDHFLLVYPNTPTGRFEAKQAVRTWLLDCELDFNGQDARQFWKAIDARRFSETFYRRAEGGSPWDMQRRR